MSWMGWPISWLEELVIVFVIVILPALGMWKLFELLLGY